MIVGHLGLAVATHRGLNRASLRWLLPAAVAPDALDVLLATTGICSPYGLYSHTVPAVVLLAASTSGAAYLFSTRSDARFSAIATAIGCTVVILLHPALDFITGHKLFWPGGELMGLALYQRPLTDFLLESSIAIAAWLMLRRSSGVPRWASTPATLCALLLLQGAANFSLRGLKPTGCMTIPASPL